MHARSLLLSTALVAIVAAGAYHWHAKQAHSRLEADRARRLAETAEQRHLYEEDSRRAAAAQTSLQVLLAERATRLAASSSARASAPPASATSTSAPKSTAAAPNPELRRWQVQAFVSDQRLRFAALLKRIGFTPENLQDFDRIQGAYQHVMLDAAQTDAAREQARQARDQQLKELFGPNHEQWLDANRNEPARAIVNQIVQQTFQSSGALTTAQADELTHIVAQHRILPSREAGARQPRYNWDQIITDAHTILAERQRDDFIAAIEFRRASDQMSEMAAKRKQ